MARPTYQSVRELRRSGGKDTPIDLVIPPTCFHYGEYVQDWEFLAGAAEVAGVLGVAANTVNAWRRRPNGFPPPITQLAHGAIWDIREVIAWADSSGRKVVDRNYRAPKPAAG